MRRRRRTRMREKMFDRLLTGTAPSVKGHARTKKTTAVDVGNDAWGPFGP